MRTHRPLVSRFLTAAVVVLGLCAGRAWAADEREKPFEEPGITYMQRSDPYIQWAAGTVIIVACLLVAFKNPHRTHTD